MGWNKVWVVCLMQFSSVILSHALSRSSPHILPTTNFSRFILHLPLLSVWTPIIHPSIGIFVWQIVSLRAIFEVMESLKTLIRMLTILIWIRRFHGQYLNILNIIEKRSIYWGKGKPSWIDISNYIHQLSKKTLIFNKFISKLLVKQHSFVAYTFFKNTQGNYDWSCLLHILFVNQDSKNSLLVLHFFFTNSASIWTKPILSLTIVLS